MRKNLDKYMNQPGTKVIMLTLTNSCNLSCVYCYEHNKQSYTMSAETAIDILEKEMTMDDGTDFVCIYYFGGEPFLEFEKIKKIHAFLKSRKWEKGWFAFATTNGTLVHDEIQQWLLENDESIEIYLSIDGTREMHNKNRSGSYDDIDTEFFIKNYPFGKVTITNETLPNLAEGIITLIEQGFEVSASLAHGIEWRENSTEIFQKQLEILMDYFYKHKEKKIINTLNLDLLDLEPNTQNPRRFCGVGPMMRSYDTSGKSYPCHAFAPLCIGKEKSEKASEIDFDSPLALSELDEKCQKCPVIGNCPTCYGINLRRFGNPYHVADDHCNMMKVQFLANAKFKYNLYVNGRLELEPEEEIKLLRNIKAVQSLAE